MASNTNQENKEWNMKSKWFILSLSALTLAACQNSNSPQIVAQKTDGQKIDVHNGDVSKKEIRKQTEDLNALRQEFITSILQADVNESPFDLYYTYRTVFFSKDIISFYGEANVYDEGDDWEYLEGKTYFNNNGKFTPVTLNDLFSTAEQKEFLKTYTDKIAQTNQVTVCNPIDQNYVQSFTLREKSLLVIFQPKTGTCDGDPFIVSIPFETLKGKWNPENPIARTLPGVLESKLFTSSWDNDQVFIEAQ